MPDQITALRLGGLRNGRVMVLAIVTLAQLAVGSGCVTLSRKVVDKDVVNARQLTNRGTEAMQNGRWDEAELLFARAINMCPVEEVRAHANYAETMWRRAEQEEAVSHMQESVRLSGGHPNRLVRLGEMYLQAGQLGKAAESADQAIRTDRHLARAHALRGKVLQHRGELERALASYHRALTYQRHYPDVQLEIANIYQRQKNPVRALATLSTLRDQYPPGDAPRHVIYQQALAQKTLGRYRDAATNLARCAKMELPDAELLAQLSEAQWMAGDRISAQFVVAQALAIDPQNPLAQQLQTRLEQQRLASRPQGPRDKLPTQ